MPIGSTGSACLGASLTVMQVTVSPLILQLLVCNNPLATDEYSPDQIVQPEHFRGLREGRYSQEVRGSERIITQSASVTGIEL
ncbi:hypothetical protein EMCG_02023 [[Emmonsia] crescens]|uniref:Uncharacterized protein n=1 Tax=[Emmonsia] crescens TaxID=73230 RepID=A0A0G2J9A8_9EURO|nr:hypothetical protein EMCG_02023 [Emmonsia crescens UAMH 3008]